MVDASMVNRNSRIWYENFRWKSAVGVVTEALLEIGTLRLEAGYPMAIQNGDNEVQRDVSRPLFSRAERPWHNIQKSVLTIQQNFIECLRSGTRPEASGNDNLKTLTLVEAAYWSAKEGRTVKTATL